MVAVEFSCPVLLTASDSAHLATRCTLLNFSVGDYVEHVHAREKNWEKKKKLAINKQNSGASALSSVD